MDISNNSKWVDVGCGERPYESFFPKGVYIGVDVKISGRDERMKNLIIFTMAPVFLLKIAV